METTEMTGKEIKKFNTWLYTKLEYREKITLKNRPAFLKNFKISMLNIYAVNHFQEILEKEKLRKKYYKKENNKISLKEKLQLKKIEQIENLLCLVGYDAKYADGIEVRINQTQTENFKFYKKENADWDYYSKSYGHPRITTKGVVSFSKKYLSTIKLKDCKIEDGLITIKNFSIKKIGNITIKKSQIFKKAISGLIIESVYIASSDGFTYHHQISAKKAILGVIRKMKANIKKNEKWSLDDMITPSKYRKLTGACIIGISDFMEKNNIKKSIKASELLTIIGNNDGSDIFRAQFKSNSITGGVSPTKQGALK